MFCLGSAEGVVEENGWTAGIWKGAEVGPGMLNLSLVWNWLMLRGRDIEEGFLRGGFLDVRYLYFPLFKYACLHCSLSKRSQPSRFWIFSKQCNLTADAEGFFHVAGIRSQQIEINRSDRKNNPDAMNKLDKDPRSLSFSEGHA